MKIIRQMISDYRNRNRFYVFKKCVVKQILVIGNKAVARKPGLNYKSRTAFIIKLRETHLLNLKFVRNKTH